MNKFFVKFVPWNEKTLSSLINKTIKFSTVHEFNDFNEYAYISNMDASSVNNNIEHNQIYEILKKKLNVVSF